MSRRPDPYQIVLAGAELVDQLSRYVERNGGGSLAHHEAGVLGLVRAWLPTALRAVIEAATPELRPEYRASRGTCPTCGGLRQELDWRPRTLKTQCGTLRWRRPWWVCLGPGRDGQRCAGFSPVDQRLEISPQQRVSAGLHQWLAQAGGDHDYQQARRDLATYAGLEVSAETVRAHTIAEGERLARQQAAQQGRLATPKQAAEATPQAGAEAPGELVVTLDGVMVRYREPAPDEAEANAAGWHEVKLGVLGGWTTQPEPSAKAPTRRQRRRAAQVEPLTKGLEPAEQAAIREQALRGALVAKSYLGAREPAAEFGRRVVGEACRRGALEVTQWSGPLSQPGLATLRRVIVLGDGAKWIWNLAAEWFGDRVEILDYYHAAQHLTTLAEAAYGVGSELAQQWVITHRERLRLEGGEPVLAAATQLPTPKDPKAQEVLVRERAYLRSNLSRLDYPRFRREGLPIGSGAVEGAASHLVALRLKRPGCRWSQRGADAVLQVRAASLSLRQGVPLPA